MFNNVGGQHTREPELGFKQVSEFQGTFEVFSKLMSVGNLFDTLFDTLFDNAIPEQNTIQKRSTHFINIRVINIRVAF